MEPKTTAKADPALGVENTLKTAWAKLWQNPTLFLGLSAIPVVLSIALMWVSGDLDTDRYGLYPTAGNSSTGSFAWVIVFLLTLVLGLVVQGALTKASVEAMRGRAMAPKEALMVGWKKLLGYVGLSIVVGVLVLVGLVLLIVPGLIFAFWYSLSSYVYFDKDSSITGAMDRSKALVKGKFGLLFLLMVLYIIASIVTGFNPLLSLVASIVLAPLAVLSLAHVYVVSEQKAK